MKNLLEGIDVSYAQGVIDWSKVKSEIDFAIIRGGYGINSIDKQAIRNIEGCKENNISFGLYWFSYALSVEDAVKEAESAIKLAKIYRPNLPIYFDLEEETVRYAKTKGVTITSKEIKAFTKAFCDTVLSAGFDTGVYSSYSYYKSYFGERFFKDNPEYKVWVAYWFATEPNMVYDVWQYSSIGCVKGIKTVVDKNKLFNPRNRFVIKLNKG